MFYAVVQLIGSRKQAENFLYRYGFDFYRNFEKFHFFPVWNFQLTGGVSPGKPLLARFMTVSL